MKISEEKRSVTRRGRIVEIGYAGEDTDEVEMTIWFDEDSREGQIVSLTTPPNAFAVRDEIEVVFRKVNEDT